MQAEVGSTSAPVPQNTPKSNSSSREASPAPIMNIFAPRARRYSASFASLGAAAVGTTSGPRLTPRVSQLRQEECIDMNSREANHEREIQNAMQMSQSWEDLTLVAENWSCKSDDLLSNPLQVTLPTGITSCSSPSPTSRTGMRLPYGLSPSPTRRTFATRRSMSPQMRPSQLGPVKRKFELDDNNWNTYSPPPLKKVFTESSRGPSPICQSPSSICPSPDSGTYEGRITPKLFVSKLYINSTNSSSSLCSSPMVPSPMMEVPLDLQQTNSSSPANMASSNSNSEACDGDPEATDIDSSQSQSEKQSMFTDGKLKAVNVDDAIVMDGDEDLEEDVQNTRKVISENEALCFVSSPIAVEFPREKKSSLLLNGEVPAAAVESTEIRCNFSGNLFKKCGQSGDNSNISKNDNANKICIDSGTFVTKNNCKNDSDNDLKNETFNHKNLSDVYVNDINIE